MATRLEVVITGDAKNLIGQMKAAGASVKEFAGEGEKGTKASQTFSGSLKDAASQIAPMLGIAAVTTAMISYGKASFDAAASSERLERANEAMANKIGETSDSIIKAIQESSNFTISKNDALQASNKAMLFGLVENRDQMAELTKIAITLGAAMGQDAKKSLDDLTTALGRQSPLILDNLGITLKLEDAYRIYANSLGKTAEQLTAEEKQQAFVNAALEIGRKKVEELGGVTLDTAGKVERMSARWEDMKIASGEAMLALEDALGILDKLNGVMDYAIGNVEAMAAAFDQGLIPGLAQLFDNANPVLQLLEGMGIDVIPDFQEATEEATEAIAKQGEAHTATTEEIAAQEEATQNLAKTQMEALIDMGKLEEEYNEKKEKLLEDRLEAENDAAKATVDNTKNLNEKLRESEQERNDKIKELEQKASQSHGELTNEKYATELDKLNRHYDEAGQKIRDSYQEENQDIQAKLDERQQAIEEQLKKEEEEYKKKANDLKLLMAAQALEQSGKLQELTGIAGITAQQYVDAVKYGAIEANKEVESEMGKIVKSFEGSQKDQKSLAESNAESIKRILGESYGSTAQAQKRATDSIVSDFERQAAAAYRAAQAGGGTVNYSSRRASGGPVSAGQRYLVGELGPEMFVPQQSGQIVPNNQISNDNRRYFSYSPTYNGVNSSNPEMDYYLMNSLAR